MCADALRVGLIGLGAIGQTIADYAPTVGVEVTAALVRSPRAEGTTHTVLSLDDLLAANPDVVIEAGGQPALRSYAPTLVSEGIDVILLSIGALTDDDLRFELARRARSSRARVVLASGATAGVDGLVAHREAGFLSVRHTSRKPPASWKGTPAERLIDLETVATPTTIFTGSAREAASAYPANANVSATIALASAGLDDTEVLLVADPTIGVNIGHTRAISKAGVIECETTGVALPGNPKSSQSTAFSALALLRRGAAQFTLDTDPESATYGALR